MKIKRFWGNTENTVRTQIYYAVIAYCLVAIIQHDMEIVNHLWDSSDPEHITNR